MAKYFHRLTFRMCPSHLEKKDVEGRIPYNATCNIIENLFFYMLPKKLDLNGMNFLNIDISDSTEPKEPIAEYKYADFIPVNSVSFYNFNFQGYLDKISTQKNKSIIDIIPSCLEALEMPTEKEKVLLDTCEEIINNSFFYRAPIKKYCKWNKKRTLHAQIILEVSEKGEYVFFECKDKKGKVVISELLFENHFYEIQEKLHKTAWKGEDFTISEKKNSDIEPKGWKTFSF